MVKGGLALKRIGVVTSGGDAPGMNAAIRAVARAAYCAGVDALGFEHGWDGLIHNRARSLGPREVGGILELGGTVLQTCRCPQFKDVASQKKAAETLAANKVDGLVVIGGDGSFRGALALSKLTPAKIVGIPATIDNDVYGTDETIGFDTAINTAIGDIDKIRDTAVSLDRVFIVEVMGRQRGFLAAMIGLTVGAELILVPEVPYSVAGVINAIREHEASGKRSGIIVAAEGVGGAREIAEAIERDLGLEARISILGYAQRGGNPTARSRYLACEFGNHAVDLLLGGSGGRAVVLRDGRVTDISLEESCSGTKELDLELLTMARCLSR